MVIWLVGNNYEKWKILHFRAASIGRSYQQLTFHAFFVTLTNRNKVLHFHTLDMKRYRILRSIPKKEREIEWLVSYVMEIYKKSIINRISPISCSNLKKLFACLSSTVDSLILDNFARCRSSEDRRRETRIILYMQRDETQKKISKLPHFRSRSMKSCMNQKWRSSLVIQITIVSNLSSELSTFWGFWTEKILHWNYCTKVQCWNPNYFE